MGVSSSVFFCAAAAGGLSFSAASVDFVTALSRCKRRGGFVVVLWVCENGDEDGKCGKVVCEKVAEKAMREMILGAVGWNFDRIRRGSSLHLK